MRATILVSVEQAGEVAAAEAWFARWRKHLTYCSENNGCGCCVDTWDVDGPEGAITDIPAWMNAVSEWSDPELASLPLLPCYAPRNPRRVQRKHKLVRPPARPE